MKNYLKVLGGENKMQRQVKFLFTHITEALSEVCCDLCCGDGKYLKHLGNGSIGIDFFRSPNLTISKYFSFKIIKKISELRNIFTALKIRPRVIVFSNTLEHILDPHVFLINIRRSMQDNTALFLTVPITHIFLYKILRLILPTFISKKWKGFLQSDHVNFFSCDTLDLTIQFSGFKIEKRYYGFGFDVPIFRYLSRMITPTYGVICYKIPNWNYRDKPSVAKFLDENEQIQFKSYTEF